LSQIKTTAHHSVAKDPELEQNVSELLNPVCRRYRESTMS